ncbi:MAG TPA: hypothetical protein DCS21_06875 [Gammaproteobacteria bacterium]|nr:hypothetical protein [Gammaproteobacteria bacterium]
MGRAANFSGGLEIDGYLYPSGLSVGAEGTGQAGELTITTPSLTLTDGGGISAQSTKTTGGNLFINAADLRLFNSQISTSVFGDAETEGGNLEINSRTVVAFDSSTITAQATQGKGGHIVINTDAFFHNAASIDDVLSASSGVSGNQGTVDVNTALDVSSAVGVGSNQNELRDAAEDPCARRKGQKKSTLTKVGRGGYPADNHPEGMTISLKSVDGMPLESIPAAPTLQEPLTLNTDRDDCRL